MGFAASLKKRFPGIILEPEDLFLLEDFQVKSLPNRVPEKEFIILLDKFPEVYDEQSGITWEISELSSVTPLTGKTVVDAGAGTGRLAFLAAPFAETVFAVEPVSRLRRFIREKATGENVRNLFVMVGFLDSIPLPDNSVDVLMTSNAIGWNLEDELKEIERVLKPDAHAIHLLRSDVQAENPFHDLLTSPVWKYDYSRSDVDGGLKFKYFKTVK
jgi:SAM-dependent methyltransferase